MIRFASALFIYPGIKPGFPMLGMTRGQFVALTGAEAGAFGSPKDFLATNKDFIELARILEPETEE